MRSAIQVLAISICSAAWLAAQSNSSFSTALVGLALDQNSQLRPIAGVPGAAQLGAALKIDPSIQVLAIGPHTDYVIGTRADSGDLLLIQRPLGDAAVTLLATGYGATAVSCSPKGKTIVAVNAANAAQVWTGLPDNPTTSGTFDVSAAGEPSAFSVSDDGQALLAASPAGSPVSIFIATGAAATRVLTSVSQFGGMAFVSGTRDALLADAASNQVSRIRDAGGAASASLLADSSAGIANPVDLASSEDGRTVFVANGNPGGVVLLDLGGAAARTIACDCTPIGLAKLNASDVFRLTDSASGLFWVFSANGPSPRITPVPPDPALAAAAPSGVQQ
ncbi:MAG: hypothetical protein JO022_09085 [Acidobacteriaceae bacterium]|nr:hypothetical protein [Acidobacteriaceae bacterium]